MAIATEISAALFTNIVASTPLNCNFPLYEADEVEVAYGTQALIAVYPTDYTVQLNEAEDFEDFTITPTAALLTKINNLIASPPTSATETNFVVVRRKLDYLTSVQPETVRYTPFLSKEIDRIHMKLIQLAEKVARTLGLPANVVGDLDTEYIISAPVEGKAPVWRGNKLEAEIDAANIAGAEGFAAAALASAVAADDSADDAALSAVDAAASAAAAQLALDGIPYRDVVFLTFANSPYTCTNADRGKLFAIDTSGGNFVFNLAQISGLTIPHTIGVKKTTADTNTVTINRGGTDNIDTGTSLVISNVTGVNLIADTDTTPDRWVSASFGASAGETKNQTFASGVGFTAGSTTQLTLTTSPTPASSAAMRLYFDAARQLPSEWSYNPGTAVITFNEAIPVGVEKVFVEWESSSVPVGTPSDGTVSWAKLASGIIASVANMVSGAADVILSAANFKSFVDQYQPRKVLSFVPAGGSTDIVIGYTFKAGFNYRIEIDNLQVGTDNTVLQMLMSSDDGASYVNSASAYTARLLYGTTGAGGNTSTSTVINATGYGMNANDPLCGTLRLFDPNNANKNPMGIFDYMMTEAAGAAASGHTGIRRNANMACNKIKLTSSTNFSNVGRITVYEEPAT